MANGGTSRQELRLSDHQTTPTTRSCDREVLFAGSHLHDNWIVILRCLSRWALVTQLASGAPTDLSLFSSVDPQQKHDLKKSWWQGARAKQSSDGAPKPPMQPGTLIDAGLSLGNDFMNKAPTPGATPLDVPHGSFAAHSVPPVRPKTTLRGSRYPGQSTRTPCKQLERAQTRRMHACRSNGCCRGGAAVPGV